MLAGYITKVIDEQVTARLRRFLENGIGEDGEERSDIIVTPEGKFTIKNAFAKLSRCNRELALQAMPLSLRMLHCKEIVVAIPWGSGSTWHIEVNGLYVIVAPTRRSEWCAEDVRGAREAKIAKALGALISKQLKAMAKEKGKKEWGVVAMLKRKLLGSFQPTIHIR